MNSYAVSRQVSLSSLLLIDVNAPTVAHLEFVFRRQTLR